MSEENQSEHNQASESTESGQQSTPGPAAVTADGYISHVKEVLTGPDEHFADDGKASRNDGLITAGIFLGLIFLHALISRVSRFSSWGFEFGYLTYAIKIMLAIGLPIVAVVFVLRWLEGRSGTARSVDFYIGRFGAMLVLPALMVAIAVPLNLFDITLHGWFRGGALILTYIAVFMLSYLYAAKGQLRTAVLMAVGFYFAYRLLLLLF